MKQPINPEGTTPSPVRWYQHYKGGVYQLLHLGTHSETGERMVVYQNKAGDVWIRPKTMFFENVEVDGETVRRFAPIREGDDGDRESERD